MYETSLCKRLSHSVVHFETLLANAQIARKRSGRQYLAAQRIFISTLSAMFVSLPSGSSVVKAFVSSVNGVAALADSFGEFKVGTDALFDERRHVVLDAFHLVLSLGLDRLFVTRDW